MFGQHDDQQAHSSVDDSAMVTNSSDPVVADTVATQSSEPVLTTPEPETLEHHDTDGLLEIKQQALSQLSPLVSHLDQSPEERFKTLMMMIQASDNQSLIKTAYETASQISDEKQKAQALLDIVNEINYFTHPKQ